MTEIPATITGLEIKQLKLPAAAIPKTQAELEQLLNTLLDTVPSRAGSWHLLLEFEDAGLIAGHCQDGTWQFAGSAYSTGSAVQEVLSSADDILEARLFRPGTEILFFSSGRQLSAVLRSTDPATMTGKQAPAHAASTTPAWRGWLLLDSTEKEQSSSQSGFKQWRRNDGRLILLPETATKETKLWVSEHFVADPTTGQVSLAAIVYQGFGEDSSTLEGAHNV